MNILFLDQFSDLGGGQLCLLDLLPAVREAGWSAVVAAPGEGKLFTRCEAAGARTHRLDIGPYHVGRKTIGDMARFVRDVPRTVPVIRRLIGERCVDLVYVNGPRLVPVAAMAAGRRLPLIFHCHSYVGESYLTASLNAALRYSDARVIACCRFAGTPFAARDPIVIYNGVADHARTRPPHSRPRAGIIGRISPEKGQAEFLKAARQIPDCDFVICGEASDPRYDMEVRELATGLPVEFTGWCDDVAPVLASLDLLVVPSAPTEATTRVILEGFSAGVPVIASRGGGIGEVVREGETGYLIDSLDAAVLAAACTKALASGNAAMSQRARRVFEERFTLSRYCADVLAVIRHAASQAKEQQRRQ